MAKETMFKPWCALLSPVDVHRDRWTGTSKYKHRGGSQMLVLMKSG